MAAPARNFVVETGNNMYLMGPFAPVQEEVTAFDLEVTGSIPKELNGRLLRNGPNPFEVTNPTLHHWFTATGMVHGLRLRDGKAEWYRNRFVQDDKLSMMKGVAKLDGPSPLASQTAWVAFNEVQTNIVAQGGKTLAIADANVPVCLSYELESLYRTDFSGTLGGGFTGHPHRDPDTGELHAVTYNPEWDYLCYQVLGVDGLVRHRVTIPVDTKFIVHDFAITANYVLIQQNPVIYDEQLAREGYGYPYRWSDRTPSRFGLMPRTGTAADLRWYDAPEQSSIFHMLNAYENVDGTVVLDAVTYGRVCRVDLNGPFEDGSRMDRFLIDPTTGLVRLQRIDDEQQEMPRLDERLTGKRHRYGYLNGIARGSALFKHDLDRGTKEEYMFGDGRFGMEAVFEPATPGAAEDDGWLLAYVDDEVNAKAEVVILHAQALDEGPIARIHLPQRVPYGFHGNWVSDSQIADVTS